MQIDRTITHEIPWENDMLGRTWTASPAGQPEWPEIWPYRFSGQAYHTCDDNGIVEFMSPRTFY